jgi:hypothetical protein
MSLNAEFPAGEHKRIDDAWITENAHNTNVWTDCRSKDSHYLNDANAERTMIPRGVMITRNADNTSTTATIRCMLWGEQVTDVDEYTLALNIVHPLAVRHLYASGTTGRGIKIFG